MMRSARCPFQVGKPSRKRKQSAWLRGLVAASMRHEDGAGSSRSGMRGGGERKLHLLAVRTTDAYYIC